MQDNKKIEFTVYGKTYHNKEHSGMLEKSQYFEQYNKILETIQIRPIKQYIDQLFKNHIFYDDSFFNNKSTSNLNIKIAKTNQFGSCLALLIIIGPFTLNIEVANAYVQSQIHSTGCRQFGSFGDVYFVQRQEKKSVIKCLRYKPKVFHDFQMVTRQNQEDGEYIESQVGNHWKQSFVNCLKQYCFYRIFSALGIGPKIKKILGFDIICYQNCFEFSIQMCNQKFQKSNNGFERELLYCLKVMHLFHIVHRDIKPQNMLFSPQQDRLVLTDFGTTHIIRQEIGNSTLYQYVVGTYGFFCKEMKERYEIWLKGKRMQPTQIDFYYNDLFGIKKSIQIIYTLKCQGNDFFPECYQLSKINLAIWIGSLIQNEQIINFLLYKQNVKQFAKWILDFTRNYSYSLKQLQVRETFIKPFIKTDKQIKQYNGRFYLNVYGKVQKLSSKEMSQIQQRKIASLWQFEKIGQTKHKQIFQVKSQVQAYVQRMFDLLQIEVFDTQDYFQLKEFFMQLQEKFEPKQDKNDKRIKGRQSYQMYYFECFQCKNVLILEQQCRFSTIKLNEHIINLIEKHIPLDEQHNRMLRKLKLYFTSSDGQLNVLVNLIQQSKSPTQGLNRYFRLLCKYRKWKIGDQLAKIDNVVNNFIDQIPQEYEKKIIRQLVKWMSIGKVRELNEIEQLYNEFINSSFLLKNMKYGLIYLGQKIIDLNLAFKNYKKVQTVQQEIISYLQHFSVTLSQHKFLQIFFCQRLIDVYESKGPLFQFKRRQLSFISNKRTIRIHGLYQYMNSLILKMKKIITQYFIKNNIEFKLNNCCLLAIYHDRNVIGLYTQSTKTFEKIKKIKSIFQLDLIAENLLKWDFDQLNSRLSILIKYKKIKPVKQQLLRKMSKAVQSFLKYQKLDFEYFDFWNFFQRFRMLRNLQGMTEQQIQIIVNMLIDRLSNKINKNALKIIFYLIFGMKERLRQIQWDQNQPIQDIYELIASQMLCQLYLYAKYASQINKGIKILLTLLIFKKQNQLGHQNDLTPINYEAIFFWLAQLNKFNEIFDILEKSLINLFMMRCSNSILIILCFNQFLKKNTFVKIHKKLLKIMEQRSFAEIEQLEQGIFLYVNLLVLVKQAEKQKTNEKEDQELAFWYQLFDLIKKHLFTVSKLSFYFLRSSLCFTIKKIYEFEQSLILKRRQNWKGLFKPADLNHPKKEKLVKRNYMKYVDCFISDARFFYDLLIRDQRNKINVFKKIKYCYETRMSKLVETGFINNLIFINTRIRCSIILKIIDH